MSLSTRPGESDHDDYSRSLARKWFWEHHDKDEYECPKCGRDIHRAKIFDVHHKDGDPTNNDPENLVALCRRCHRWRHEGPTLGGLDTEEWKDAFLDLGGGSDV